MVEALVRGFLALVSFAVFAAIALSEESPFFLILGAVFAVAFWRFGRRRRRRGRGGEASGWFGGDGDDGGGWFGGGDGGGGNGGGSGD